jgi:thiol-disulfide isomerase/thioredoxin
MIEVFLFLSVGTAKSIQAQPKTVDSLLTDHSLVFFTSRSCRGCRETIRVLDKLADKYKTLPTIVVDTDKLPLIAARYAVIYTPQLSVFHRTKLISNYVGEWDAAGLTKLYHSITSSSVSRLNSSFDLFEFQCDGPLNLVVSGSNLDAAERLNSEYSGALKVGFLTDRDVTQELELPPFLLSKPNENFFVSLSDISEIDRYLLSPFAHVNNSELFQSCPTYYCLFVVLDERDPLQLKHAAERMRQVYEVFGQNITYRFGDWFVGTFVVESVGLATFQNPLFVLVTNLGHNFEMEPFRKRSTQPSDVVNWLRRKILREQPAQVADDSSIPKLTAAQFIQIALDPKTDVVLLVGTPDMPYYDEAQQNMRILIECFKEIQTVKFFSFNIATEKLPGLEIPKSDKPLLSIWPATEGLRGSTFGAYLSIPVVLDKLLQLIVTQVSDPQLEQMAARVQAFLEQEN